MPSNKLSTLSESKLAEIKDSISEADIQKEVARKYLSRPGMDDLFAKIGGVPESVKIGLKKKIMARKVQLAEAELSNNT